VRVAYAWVLDGVSTIFVDDEALDDTWALAQGFASTTVGLVRPASLPLKINLRTLVLEQTPVKIVVEDLGDTLAALFGPARETAEDLVTTLAPATVPAPMSLWGKQVGLEQIGPAGERRRYSVVPGFEVGLAHLGQNDAYATGSAPSPVSDSPVLWAGRRCAIYRVAFDDAAGAFEDLADAQRIWWGSLRAKGSQNAKTWTFGCFGPRSWHDGNLATGNFENPLRIMAINDFADDGFAGPTVIRSDLEIVQLQDTTNVIHVYSSISDASGTSNMGAVSGYDARGRRCDQRAPRCSDRRASQRRCLQRQRQRPQLLDPQRRRRDHVSLAQGRHAGPGRSGGHERRRDPELDGPAPVDLARGHLAVDRLRRPPTATQQRHRDRHLRDLPAGRVPVRLLPGLVLRRQLARHERPRAKRLRRSRQGRL
jgi:hypothetical protein